MATFLKEENGWRCQVRLKGKSKSKRFRTKAEAARWAIAVETQILNGDFDAPAMTLAELIDKYINEVSTKKRGYREEKLRLLRLAAMPIGSVQLRYLTQQDMIYWRDLRLSKVTPASVLREWATFEHVIKKAVEWRLIGSNLFKGVEKPQAPLPRTRRYSDDEINTLVFVSGFSFDELPVTSQSRTGAALLFALETAMRAGEICNLTWDNIYFEKKIAHLPITKNGHARDVPLSKKALAILEHLQKISHCESVFNLTSKTLDTTFRKLKTKANLDQANLHFHDARREALTRLSKKVDVMTLAKISGHRDIKILLNTYYAPKMEDVANLLD